MCDISMGGDAEFALSPTAVQQLNGFERKVTPIHILRWAINWYGQTPPTHKEILRLRGGAKRGGVHTHRTTGWISFKLEIYMF